MRDRPQGSGYVLLAAQGYGEVELIVRIVGIGGHRLLEKGGGIQTPAAGRHALVVDHFRQRQLLADKSEGVFRLDVTAQIEISQAAIEVGLAGIGVVARQASQGGGRQLKLLVGEIGLAQSQQRGREAGVQPHRFFQVPDLFVGIGLHQPADVVLKGVHPQPGAGGDEGVAGDGELRIELLGQPPGKAVQHIEQMGHIRLFLNRRGHVQSIHFQHLGLGLKAGAGGRKRPYDEVVRIQRLRQANGAGAGRLKGGGQPQVVECIEPVIAADGHKSGRGQTPVQHLRNSFADPVQVRLVGAVVEGEHQQAAVPATVPARGSAPSSTGQQKRQDQQPAGNALEAGGAPYQYSSGVRFRGLSFSARNHIFRVCRLATWGRLKCSTAAHSPWRSSRQTMLPPRRCAIAPGARSRWKSKKRVSRASLRAPRFSIRRGGSYLVEKAKPTLKS